MLWKILQIVKNLWPSTTANAANVRQQLQLSVTLNNNGQVSRTSGTVAPSSLSQNDARSSEHMPAMDENGGISTNDDATTTTSTTTSTAVVSMQYDENGIPKYKMSRQVATVSDLWDEWSVGRDGNWSVQELEEKWGTKWRREDKKWFNLRKKIVDAISDLEKDLGLSTPRAIRMLQQAINERHWSLDKLGTELQKGRYYPSPPEETKRRKLNQS